MINWQRAAIAGLIAGAVFVVMEMVLVTIALDGAPWGPPRMMAAIVMGQDVLPPPPTFDFMIVMVGMIVHFILSAVYGVVIALLTRNSPLGIALAIGAGIGLVIYVINFYGLTAVFPWFAMARNWVTISAHIVFGLVAAWFYRSAARAPERVRQPG